MSTLIKKLRVNTLVWAVPLGAVVGAILALMLTATMPKSYTASTVLFIGSPAAGDSAGAYQGDLFSQQRAGTYAQLFTGDDLAVKVNDDLSLGLTPSELASKVTAAAVEKTVLLQVDVVDGSPTRAADIANAYASNFAQFVGQLENPTGGGQPSSLVTVITAAEAPAAPTSPSSTTNLAAGVVAGGALAGAVVWLRRRLDKRVRSVDALSEAAGAPVLGRLPADSARGSTLISLPENSTDGYTESARKLRTTVQFVDADKQKESLVVTGVGDSAASREVAATLALLLTETGRTVVLVDADLREASLHRYVGAPDAAVGLTDVLAGAIMVEDAVTTVAGGRLSFLAAGSASSTPGEDIAANLMRTVLAELARTYDHVVVAAAAADAYADAAVLSHDVDGTVVVVREGASTAAQVSTAARALRSTGGTLYGTVLVAKTGSSATTVSNAPTRVAPSHTSIPEQSPVAVSRTRRTEVDHHTPADRVLGRDDVVRDDVRRSADGVARERRDDDRWVSDHDRFSANRKVEDAITDPFPAVTAEEAGAVPSAMEWAPAAPVRRHVPSRPFPRAALPAASEAPAPRSADVVDKDVVSTSGEQDVDVSASSSDEAPSDTLGDGPDDTRDESGSEDETTTTRQITRRGAPRSRAANGQPVAASGRARGRSR
ncbi:polysaccharide biosynthesis tyrosine autokinase [Rhodococcus sp. SORGH_AS_0303]|uniref:polysaccharide biosynthesis tyrosine autokinase n=1 Tax=Rhodococcus sp. SORGH_AS_0303 TaxID=3041753 RepID=UPI0027847F35|nr:polysaccharide biosynthesis tyrosine autokinase [Rhodococcus sp. SORGH_AS_0303]MDQ1203273.1 succinoglycan biosynthesis transport protein ExoP [Rhodococcus sp. SORGH_AS_0303]